MRIRVPAGVTAVSVQGQGFSPDRSGVIEVPDHLGKYLTRLGVGFAQISERLLPDIAASSVPAGRPLHSALVKGDGSAA